MTQTEEKIKIALAIYRGLDDAERERRRTSLRELARTDKNASLLYSHIVRAETDIVRERQQADKLREEVRRLSELVHSQADNGQRTMYADTSENVRPKWFPVVGFVSGALAIGYVGMALVEAVVTSGLLVWLVGAAALALCLSGIDWKAMRAPAEAEQEHAGRVTNIYVTQDGPINITKN